GPGSPRDHALISLLAINGLRISEALGADIDDLDVDRGHRTLRVVRKGGKQVTIPLAPPHGSSTRPVHRRTSDRSDLPRRRWDVAPGAFTFRQRTRLLAFRPEERGADMFVGRECRDHDW